MAKTKSKRDDTHQSINVKNAFRLIVVIISRLGLMNLKTGGIMKVYCGRSPMKTFRFISTGKTGTS